MSILVCCQCWKQFDENDEKSSSKFEKYQIIDSWDKLFASVIITSWKVKLRKWSWEFIGIKNHSASSQNFLGFLIRHFVFWFCNFDIRNHRQILFWKHFDENFEETISYFWCSFSIVYVLPWSFLRWKWQHKVTCTVLLQTYKAVHVSKILVATFMKFLDIAPIKVLKTTAWNFSFRISKNKRNLSGWKNKRLESGKNFMFCHSARSWRHKDFVLLLTCNHRSDSSISTSKIFRKVSQLQCVLF